MYQDTPGAINKIAAFLNIPIDKEILTKIVNNCTITEMRETSNFGLNHLRQGGYGNWRASFTVLMSEFFDDVCFLKLISSMLPIFIISFLAVQQINHQLQNDLQIH